MLKPWRDILLFVQVGNGYLKEHAEDTKLKYALIWVQTRLARYNEEITELMGDIDIDCCEVTGEPKVATDPPAGLILRDAQGQLQFSREGMKERGKRQRELLSREFEVEPYYVEIIPDNLTLEQISVFTDYVLRAQPVTTSAPVKTVPVAPVKKPVRQLRHGARPST